MFNSREIVIICDVRTFTTFFSKQTIIIAINLWKPYPDGYSIKWQDACISLLSAALPFMDTNFCVFCNFKLGPVSNERPGCFTVHKDIHEFFEFYNLLKDNDFLKFYAVITISQKILWNCNYSIKTVIFSKRTMITVMF